MKAEGYIGHGELLAMGWDEILAELEDFAAYHARRAEAEKAAMDRAKASR